MHNPATALWIAMTGHHVNRQKEFHASDCWFVRTYTRHTFTIPLTKFTDDMMRILGTVRINLVDKFNKHEVQKAMPEVGSMEHGHWKLIAGYIVFKDRKVVVFYK